MGFSPEVLYKKLRQHAPGNDYLIAYSGGMDSHVLLHAMAYLRCQYHLNVNAIHINHGQSPDSKAWSRHCRRVCSQLDVHLEVVSIDPDVPTGTSLEAVLRDRRYRVFTRFLQENDTLLTGHQADDQAETVLLHLLRGSGPPGLAAMPFARTLGDGRHLRPLLAHTREELRDYALRHRLVWIEDTSNEDQRFDRNYLRHTVMPLLKQRWKGVLQTLARTASIQAEVADLLLGLAEQDIENAMESDSAALSIPHLASLSPARQKNLLRYWIKACGFGLPDSRQLDIILKEVVHARPDADPCVSWPGARLRRYRDRLYVMSPLPDLTCGDCYRWKIPEPLELPLGQIQARSETGSGLKQDLCSDAVEVRFRTGGEIIRLSNREHHKKLKKLLQEAGVPPWLRPYIPLVYIDNELAAVADLWVDNSFAAEGDSQGWVIEWQIPALDSGYSAGRTDAARVNPRDGKMA